ncbi:ROK family protein, partial [Francisella tularensis subsp. holarctica]|uniref:ROK family protein n=1 Tax=Francisella tularensis TaxID=263 RepID=UPI002381B9F5
QHSNSFHEIHLQELLDAGFKVPEYTDKDAHCFAIGQRIYGKGKQYENFGGISIGTGIGGGIINKGSFVNDSNCGAGEF